MNSPDSRSVDLAGLVNPEGHQTSAHFEYFDGTSWVPTAPDTVLNGTTDQPITAHVAGLQPYTSYRFRVVATDTRTTAVSVPATARTAGEAPAVVTGASSELTTTSASVEGTVTPLGLQSGYYFEYGTTGSYGLRSPSGAPGVVGNGYAAKVVSAKLKDLTPGTVYHYRLVAVNAAGTTYGSDRTFSTTSSDQRRAYEMVSPTEKTAVPTDAYFSGFKARPDGNGIVYTTQKAAYDDEQAAPYVPRVLGTRSPAGWSSVSLDPPLTTSISGQDTFSGCLRCRTTWSHALIITTRRLGPRCGRQREPVRARHQGRHVRAGRFVVRSQLLRRHGGNRCSSAPRGWLVRPRHGRVHDTVPLLPVIRVVATRTCTAGRRRRAPARFGHAERNAGGGTSQTSTDIRDANRVSA